jgi:pimeloyl-ACP methyl ester carboxylesterase
MRLWSRGHGLDILVGQAVWSGYAAPITGSWKVHSVPDFDSQGVRLSYVTSGRATVGQSPVLLMHGFASSIDMNWIATGWIKDLTAAGYYVVAFDHRGHGNSEKHYRPEGYGTDIMADDARRLLDYLSIERVHIIGYSMGARIGACFAVRFADRVDHLVLGGIGENFINGLPGTNDIIAALNATKSDDVETDVGRSFRAFALQTRSDLKALAACIGPVREPLPAEFLKQIRCPVLVAVGTEDKLAGRASALARRIPGAIAFDIQGREHMKAVADASFKRRVFAFLKNEFLEK